MKPSLYLLTLLLFASGCTKREEKPHTWNPVSNSPKISVSQDKDSWIISNNHGREEHKYGLIVGPVLHRGVDYRLTFSVKAEKANGLALTVVTNTAHNTWYQAEVFPHGSTFDWQKRSYQFRPSAETQVMFLSQDHGRVELRDIQIERVK